MKFIPAIKSFYKRFLDFKGRSSRSEYWWVQLFYVLAGLLCFLPVILSYILAGPEAATETSSFLFLIPVFLFALINFIPMLALTVRRFHDQNLSGWLSLISFVPYGGFVILVFMCLKGTVGVNKFGDDPLAPIDRIFD